MVTSKQKKKGGGREPSGSKELFVSSVHLSKFLPVVLSKFGPEASACVERCPVDRFG